MTSCSSNTPSPAAPRAAAARASAWPAVRVVALALLGTGVFFASVLLAYELAVARVPHHRAALERIVRTQTGLDVRFSELALRWGWYGPEAVFRRVELGEPGRSDVLLRAPELVVGFDAWRSMRSGQLEPGRITLVTPDIDLATRMSGGAGAGARAGDVAVETGAARLRILRHWRGGRIDIEGGTVRIPDPNGPATPLTVQLRQASLRHSASEWSAYGLVLLPDRLGQTARVVLRLDGDPEQPEALSATVRFEGHRLLFSGWRAALVGFPTLAAYVPVAGDGDVDVNVVVEHGRLLKADGKVRAAGVELARLPDLGESEVRADSAAEAGRFAVAAAGGSGASGAGAPAGDVGQGLAIDRVRGEWRLARRAFSWRLQVDSLEIGDPVELPGIGSGATQFVSSLRHNPATLTVDAAPSGAWIRGKLESAPLASVLMLTRWIAPPLQLAGVELAGTVRNLAFDWNELRPEGARLQTSAELEDVALTPPARGFVLTGLAARVSGNESELTANVAARSGRLEVAQSPHHSLEDLRIVSQLRMTRGDGGWQISTDDLDIRQERAQVTISGSVSGSLTGDVSGSAPEIAARGTVAGADVALLRALLGARSEGSFGTGVGTLTAGQIENVEFEVRGPLDEQLPYRTDGGGFSGSLDLRGASASGGDSWPDVKGADAHVQWHGSELRVSLERARAGAFELGPAKAEWDALGRNPIRVTGRVVGNLEDALAWLRVHPELQGYVPMAQIMSVRGGAVVDFSLTAPPGSRVASSAADMHQDAEMHPAADRHPAADVHTHINAMLDGAQLQAVPGVPPVEGVRGTLTFNTGHLERTTLTGTWLGGPVLLRVGERHERGVPVVAIEARGVLDPRQLQLPATADGGATLQGTTEWRGELAYFPEGDSRGPRWRVRADSSLVGIVSDLPEPLGKNAGAAVPLHAEAQGGGDAAELRVSVGDRLRSVWALRRVQDAPWRVERGHVRLGANPAKLPDEPLVWVEGRVGQLDLPAYVATWHQFRNEAGAPPVRADLVASRLSAAGNGYRDVVLHVERSGGADELRLESGDLSGEARWPVGNDGAPVEVRFAKLSLGDGVAGGTGVADAGGVGGDELLGLRLIGTRSRTASISVDDLVWQGHDIGRFSASLDAGDATVELSDMRLSSSTQRARGSMRCESAACRLKFTLESGNAAATLEAFGYRPELTAAAATLEGDLQWQLQSDSPALATLAGRLSMRLEDGVARAGPTPESSEGRPFALLSVPALVSGLMQPTDADVRQQLVDQHELRFNRLAADFELRGGEASTSNLHFDGDAEILMRGRTGLLARDYDQQVWILRGEDRLPAAVRRLGPTPRVAAVWLSLRDLFTESERDRSRAVLRLQGSWDDPIVVAAQ